MQTLIRQPRGCCLVVVAAVAGLMLLGAAVAFARDLGQWETSNPEIITWYQNLMMPDAPSVSCCGEADAYWADTFEVQDGKYVAIITDDRPDAPRHRPHRDVGQRVVIPNYKVKFNEGNPTGHGVLFIGANGGIYCYVPPGGV
jgi:hypothetical protein